MKKIYILVAWCLWCVQAHAQSCTVNAGADITVCGNSTATMAATASGSVVSYKWTSTGSGSFSPSSTALNPVYIPSPADYGTTVVVTFKGYRAVGDSCSDNVNITVVNPPVVDAGPNKEICLYSTSTVLSGTRTNATGQIWSTTGSGSFSPSATSTLTPTYNTSSSDQANGTVKVYLTSTGNGVCAAAKDSMIISINSATSFIDANANTQYYQTICASSSTVNLNSSRSGGSGQLWSTSGTGSFSSTTAVSPVYTLSLADKSLSQIVFRLVSTGNGTCGPQQKDSVVLNILNYSVDAGPSRTVCATATSVNLNGSATAGLTNLVWGRVTGTGFINPYNAAVATYTPTADDIAAGSVILRLISQDSGPCKENLNDTMKITFVAKPVVDAGANKVACASDTVTLIGTVSGAAGQVWSSLGTGTFTSTSSLSTKYILSAADRTAGSVIIRLTSTGAGVCAPVKDSMIITLAAATMDAGPNQTLCITASSVNLSGSRVGSTGQVWTTSGNGTFSSTTVLNPTYTFSAGDKAAGKVTLYITSTGNVGCPAGRDSVVITFQQAPVVDAGANQNGCTTMTGLGLQGSFANCGGITWSTTGTGTLTVSSSITANYTVTTADKTAGSVIFRVTSTGNGVCAAVTDSMILSIVPPPTINAGADKFVCTTATNVSLSATKTGSSTGQSWSASGSGSYSPGSTSLNTTYTFTAADKTNGYVRFIVTTTGNGGCASGRDTVMVYFTGSSSSANAGPDQTLCLGILMPVQLNGSIVNAPGGRWTSDGSGTFSPNDSTLTAQYIPSSADVIHQNVTLTLTTRGGSCPGATDNMVISFATLPSVDAGTNKTVCTTTNTVSQTGSRSGGSGQTWTTSGTGTFVSATVLSPTYNISAADKAEGTVTLYITVPGNSICPEVKDSAVITIQAAPVIDAGLDQTICVSYGSVGLDASQSGGTGRVWSSVGGGSFVPNNTSLNPSYMFSIADKAAGFVTLKVTTTGNGTCAPAKDSLVVYMTTPATVDAGLDTSVCKSANSIQLHGTRTGDSSQVWSTSGTGTFSPSNTVLNPTYIFSAADKAAGTIVLRLSSMGITYCPQAVDSMVIHFTNTTANAGYDQTLCGDSMRAQLNGSVTNATGGIWSTTGTGSFYPNDTTLTAQYLPGIEDYYSGPIKLSLTTYGSSCTASDTVVYLFAKPVFIYAGSDQTLCRDTNSVYLAGSAVNISSVSWTTSGSGFFTPADTSLAWYTPSLADKAAGQVWLTFTGYTNGICPSRADSLLVKFVSCQDTCASMLSVSDNLYGKDLTASAYAAPYKPGTYQWTFGDGNYAYGQNISHTYASPGTYQLCLNFFSDDSLCHLQYCKTIKVNKCYVTVQFTKNVSQDTAFFTASTAPATPGEYFWNFGDGVISKGQNVMHIYANSGTYPVGVSFYSTDNLCVCEAVFVDSVKIRTCPKISFNQSLEGNTVTLTAVSNTAATGTYYWDFGDGTFGTGTSVTHTYSSLGTYPVLLEFFSHNGTCQCLCHSEFNKNVKVSNCNLEASFSDSVMQNTVTFQATPTMSSTVYYWNFGDGVQQATTNSMITHYYAHGGSYVVTLTISNHSNPFDTCEASVSDSVSIEEYFELFRAPSISLHPNPATETLNYKIEIDEPILAEAVEIVNGMGTVAERKDNVTIDPQGNSFDISTLSPGLYVIKINSGGTIYSKQFLKN